MNAEFSNFTDIFPIRCGVCVRCDLTIKGMFDICAVLVKYFAFFTISTKLTMTEVHKPYPISEV